MVSEGAGISISDLTKTTIPERKIRLVDSEYLKRLDLHSYPLSVEKAENLKKV